MPRRNRLEDRLERRQHAAGERNRRAGQQNQYAAREPPTAAEPFSMGEVETCEHCEAFRFPEESLNCCHNGKVVLPQLFQYPEAFKIFLWVTILRQETFETTFANTTVQWHLLHLGLNYHSPQVVGHTASESMVRFITVLDHCIQQ